MLQRAIAVAAFVVVGVVGIVGEGAAQDEPLNEGITGDQPLRGVVEQAEAQGFDPVLELALQEAERLTREIDALDENDPGWRALGRSLAANLAIAGQR